MGHAQGGGGGVVGKCDDKPMSCVAALRFRRNQITYTIITVPAPTVAWTRVWLILEGGGGYSASIPVDCSSTQTSRILLNSVTTLLDLEGAPTCDLGRQHYEHYFGEPTE